LLKDHETNFTAIISSNLKIITSRLDKIDNEVNNNKLNIRKVENEVNDIKVSINFQEEKFREELIQIQSNYNKEIMNLKQKSIDLENRSRRNNLRIDGIKETTDESWSDCEKAVKEIFKTKLNILNEIVVERAHRVGALKDKTPRSIVLKLLNYQDKNKILSSVHKLKGSGIYINEDYAKETMLERKKLWEEVKRLRNEGKFAIIKFDKIYCRDFKK
jgi:DNA anti-recombination protein RmuC